MTEDTVVLGIATTLAFFVGTVAGAYFLEKDHRKELKAAQGCPRCLQFHKLANAARTLKGHTFKPSGLAANDPNDVVLKALNAIASCDIPPPISADKPTVRRVR